MAVRSANSLLLLLLCIMGFISCSIEKRRYLDGYHVEWKNRDRHHPKSELADNEEVAVAGDSHHQEPSVLAEVDTNQSPPEVVASDGGITDSHDRIEETNEPSGNVRVIAKPKSVLKVLERVLTSRTNEATEPETDFQSLNSAGVALGIVGLILTGIALILFIIALFISEGWAALGYIAMALVTALAAFLFTMIAQIIFWSEHQGIPWFQLPGLAIGALGLYVLIRILFDR